jgi:predicted aspartyl protease
MIHLRSRLLGRLLPTPRVLVAGIGVAGLIALGAEPRGVAEEHLYKWTDEQGVIHFSNSSLPRRYAGDAEVRTPLPAHVAPTRRSTGAVIPLVSEDRKKFVRARLEGTRSTQEVMMLVDTGAQMTLINEELAEDLGAEFVEEAGIVGVTGVAPGWMGKLRRLELGDRELRDWTVMVGPVPGLVLLGLDVLERLRLSVAADHLEVR